MESSTSLDALLSDRDVYQIQWGESKLWPEWSRFGIGSFEGTVNADNDDWDLFKNRLSKGDVVVAQTLQQGALTYGIGIVIAEYESEYPEFVREVYSHPAESSSKQIAVDWTTVASNGEVVNIPYEKFPDGMFVEMSESFFDRLLDAIDDESWPPDREEILESLSTTISGSKFNPERNQAIGELVRRNNLGVVHSDQVELGELVFRDEGRIVRQALDALANGKHLILTGPPGTGKTKLAKALARTLSPEPHQMVTATADWSTFDTIGGYHPSDDGNLSFSPGVFLDSFKQNNYAVNRWLVIDEINRCNIDEAFGSLFSALTGDDITLPFRASNGERIQVVGDPDEVAYRDDPPAHRYDIPTGWRLIATMNTYDKMSLFDLSYAFMRRFAFIDVSAPNEDEIDASLVERYLEAWEMAEAIDDDTASNVAELWRTINQSEARTIGPALIRDIVGHTIQSDGDYTAAVKMYVLPQFEGLPDRKQAEIIESLCGLERIDLDERRIREFALEYFEIDRRALDQS